jgi:hypothetical protein
MSVVSSGGWGWGSAFLELFREVKPCPSECEIEFYYHMHGEDGQLMVYLEETESNKAWDIYTRLWMVSGNQGKFFLNVLFLLLLSFELYEASHLRNKITDLK